MIFRILASLALLVLGAVLLVVIASFAVGKQALLELVFGPAERSQVDFETLQLSPKPNQYLVCPPGYCPADTHLTSPVFDVSKGELQQAWSAMIDSEPRVRRLGSSLDGAQIDYEATTPLMGYPDTVTVRFLEATEGGSTLVVFSRSHYGYGDLGANKKRIDDWLAKLADSLNSR